MLEAVEIMSVPATIEVTMEMTANQCRAARTLLGWKQVDLADKANVGRSTVYDFEQHKRNVSREKVQAMRIALEQGGIFFNDNDGVSLRRRK